MIMNVNLREDQESLPIAKLLASEGTGIGIGRLGRVRHGGGAAGKGTTARTGNRRPYRGTKPSLATAFPPTEIVAVVKSKDGKKKKSRNASTAAPAANNEQQSVEASKFSSLSSSAGTGTGTGNSNSNGSGSSGSTSSSGGDGKLRAHLTSSRYGGGGRTNHYMHSGRSVASNSIASSITNGSGFSGLLSINEDEQMAAALEASRWEEQWTCPCCTYINRPMFLTCEMCGNARTRPRAKSPLRKPLSPSPSLPKRSPTLESMASKKSSRSSKRSNSIEAPKRTQSASSKKSHARRKSQDSQHDSSATGFLDAAPRAPRRALSFSSRASSLASGLQEIAADANLNFASWGDDDDDKQQQQQQPQDTHHHKPAKAKLKVFDVDNMIWDEQSVASGAHAAFSPQRSSSSKVLDVDSWDEEFRRSLRALDNNVDDCCKQEERRSSTTARRYHEPCPWMDGEASMVSC